MFDASNRGSRCGSVRKGNGARLLLFPSPRALERVNAVLPRTRAQSIGVVIKAGGPAPKFASILVTDPDAHLSTTGLNLHPGRIRLAEFRNLHGADIAKKTGSKIARHVMGDWGERLVVVPTLDRKT